MESWPERQDEIHLLAWESVCVCVCVYGTAFGFSPISYTASPVEYGGSSQKESFRLAAPVQ